MSKKVVTNTWNDGLNKDLNPNVTPNTVLTDNLNGTFITYNGEELVLQNDMGNVETARLTKGFFPIGATEYEGIIYIVSVRGSNTDTNASTIIPEVIPEVIPEPDSDEIEENDGYYLKFIPVPSSNWEAKKITYRGNTYNAIETTVPYATSEDPDYKKVFQIRIESNLPGGLRINHPGGRIYMRESGSRDWEYGNFYDVSPNQYGKTFDIMVNTYEEAGVNLQIYANANYSGKYYYRMIHIIQLPKGAETIPETESDEKVYGVRVFDKNGVAADVSNFSSSVETIARTSSDSVWFKNVTAGLAQRIYNYYSENGYNCWITSARDPRYEIPLAVSINTESATSAVSSYVSATVAETTSSNTYAFEIGSYPSLNPEGWHINKESDSDPIEFENKYRPLYNLIDTNDDLVSFSTSFLKGYSINNPVHIEVQSSYDGSVNLILTDGKNPIRLINTGFAAIGNNQGKFVKRNQTTKTNYYEEKLVDQLTKLIRTTVNFSAIELEDVLTGGKLKGGNYTFYVRLSDEDGNKTDIVAESGIVSIFHGTIGDPRTISGAFADEITDKLVVLKIHQLDTAYSQLHVSYTRESCDLNGSRITEAFNITKTYSFNSSTAIITITGLEEVEPISLEDLNVAYYSINSAKTIAQQQKMLFLGNVDLNNPDSEELQNLSYKIKVSVKQEFENENIIGAIDNSDYSPIDAKPKSTMYYDPKNIYYNVGYWPDELYRFGVVYIKNDGTTTPVYNLLGRTFTSFNQTNTGISNYASKEYPFLESDDRYNIAGIFKTPDADYTQFTYPIFFQFSFDSSLTAKLNTLGINGYMIVRQKRIPITICQGLTAALNKYSYYPVIYGRIEQSDGSFETGYWSQSFLTKTGRQLIYTPYSEAKRIPINGAIFYIGSGKEPYTRDGLFGVYQGTESYFYVIGPKGNILDYIYYKSKFKLEIDNYIREHNITLGTQIVQPCTNLNSQFVKHEDVGSSSNFEQVDAIEENAAALISVEADINPEIQSMLNGANFDVVPIADTFATYKNLNFPYRYTSEWVGAEPIKAKLVYIPEGTSYKQIDHAGFSNMVGDGINPQEFGHIIDPENNDYETQRPTRGVFTSFIGMAAELPDSKQKDGEYEYDIRQSTALCNIRIPHSGNYKNEIITRSGDNSPFYAVSNRIGFSAAGISSVSVYRGDCYECQVTVRMHRNFVDQNAPIAEQIVNKDCWADWYRGVYNVLGPGDQQDTNTRKTDWSKINVGDLNTVALGHWITFKCFANTNLGLRTIDTSNSSEMAIMGNPRSFYPLYGLSTETGMKLSESNLFNRGYESGVGKRRYYLKEKTPYDKTEFSTRVMFSNVSVTDSFTNGYRVFQGLAYQDFTKQYGSITKILPWGNNLFIVFEHGLAIAPVNEKALLQTTTEQTIHIYGHDVLSEQLSIVSQDFGSTWADSVIRTPVGIYGFDTSAKKIWRFSDANGLEMISDMHVQRFLNDNTFVDLTENVILGTTDVRTHYNNYKGDVMFVLYNGDTEWNLCYNERQSLWITRYDWTPLISTNVDNSFYSINKNESDSSFRIFKHGRTGVDSNFRPCLWYGEQHPFEYEFVVNDPAGVHKIFDNLAIISNNVQPIEIEFEFVGDSYLFNRSKVYHNQIDLYGNHLTDIPYEIDGGKDDYPNLKQLFYNVSQINYNNVSDEYTLVVNQLCKNKDSYGIRLGNIQYKEDGWYTNIEPLRYNEILKNPNLQGTTNFASAKIRDKWIKIRIKYKGDRLALINAVSTFETISYA